MAPVPAAVPPPGGYPCSAVLAQRLTPSLATSPAAPRTRAPKHFLPNNSTCADRQAFVDGIDGIPDEAKAELRLLTPATYVGNAAAQAKALKSHPLR